MVIGVIERFVEPDLRVKLKDADDDLRLIEDLGIDSLTMMEIVILVEDVLQMTINNDELRNLRTVGDVKTFIDCKIRGLPLPKPTKFIPIEQIGAVMPVQPPFLFLNEASVSSTTANGKYKITGQEFFLQGHFKDNPVMPASIMLEAVGQLAVLFLLEGAPVEPGKVVGPHTIFFAGCEGVRAHRVCKPGDLLSLSIKPKRMKMPLATFEGSIRVGQEKAVIVEEITLTFAFVESAVAPGRGERRRAAGRRQRQSANAASGWPLTPEIDRFVTRVTMGRAAPSEHAQSLHHRPWFCHQHRQRCCHRAGEPSRAAPRLRALPPVPEARHRL